MHIAQQQRELIAPPAGEHAFERGCGFFEAPRGLHHHFIAGRVPQRVVDQFEAVHIDEDDGNVVIAPRAHVAQRAVELVHEIAAIGQPGERIVVARVVDTLLQPLALLDLSHQALVHRM